MFDETSVPLLHLKGGAQMTISESDFILRLGAGMVMVLAAVGLASGELIDDFNDGNDDG